MGNDRVSRPGGLNIPHVRQGDKANENELQFVDIHPFIIKCTHTLLQGSIIPDVINQFREEHALLNIGNPYDIFEEITGQTIARPQNMGFYKNGAIYVFE